jgi:hypothetical protein
MVFKKILNPAAVLMSLVIISGLFETMDRFGVEGTYIA